MTIHKFIKMILPDLQYTSFSEIVQFIDKNINRLTESDYEKIIYYFPNILFNIPEKYRESLYETAIERGCSLFMIDLTKFDNDIIIAEICKRALIANKMNIIYIPAKYINDEIFNIAISMNVSHLVPEEKRPKYCLYNY